MFVGVKGRFCGDGEGGRGLQFFAFSIKRAVNFCPKNP